MIDAIDLAHAAGADALDDAIVIDAIARLQIARQRLRAPRRACRQHDRRARIRQRIERDDELERAVAAADARGARGRALHAEIDLGDQREPRDRRDRQLAIDRRGRAHVAAPLHRDRVAIGVVAQRLDPHAIGLDADRPRQDRVGELVGAEVQRAASLPRSTCAPAGCRGSDRRKVAGLYRSQHASEEFGRIGVSSSVADIDARAADLMPTARN